ncbi:SprB repeat-containing protein, partial [Herbiconiux daphne]
AFSLDKDNANDNLRRAGYYRQYRKRYLELYDCIIAQPDMQNIPLSDLTEHWWDPIAICPLVPAGPVALGIKTNPVDVTALEGTTATFSVEAKGGTAPYTYQWEYSLMLANWVNASGGTSQTYSPTVETNTDGLHYRCVIKDAAGATVTSGYGKLTMIPKLAWNAHPATGTIGTDLDFSWTGGIAPFTVVVLNPAGTEH